MGKEIRAFQFGAFSRYRNEIKKRAGVYRIAVIGDSYTFGWMLKETEDRYSDILADMLNRSKGVENRLGGIKRVEAFNYSIPGSNTRDEIGFYENNARKYEPDLVILGISPVDIMAVKKRPPMPLFVKSHFARYVFYLVHKRSSNILIENVRRNIYFLCNDSGAREVLGGNLSDFKKRCSGDGTDFLAVMMPFFDCFTCGELTWSISP